MQWWRAKAGWLGGDNKQGGRRVTYVLKELLSGIRSLPLSLSHKNTLFE